MFPQIGVRKIREFLYIFIFQTICTLVFLNLSLRYAESLQNHFGENTMTIQLKKPNHDD
jgi:hypothetical protein